MGLRETERKRERKGGWVSKAKGEKGRGLRGTKRKGERKGS